MKHGVDHGTSQHQGTPTCRRLAAPRRAAGVVKMRRGLTAKYMAQLVSMREIYEAFDTWAAEIDSKSQRVSPAFPDMPLFAGIQDSSAPGNAVHAMVGGQTSVLHLPCWQSLILTALPFMFPHAFHMCPDAVLGLIPTGCDAAGAAQQQAAGQGDGATDAAADGGDPAAVQRGHCKVPPAPPLRYFMCFAHPPQPSTIPTCCQGEFSSTAAAILEHLLPFSSPAPQWSG